MRDFASMTTDQKRASFEGVALADMCFQHLCDDEDFEYLDVFLTFSEAMQDPSISEDASEWRSFVLMGFTIRLAEHAYEREQTLRRLQADSGGDADDEEAEVPHA